jgi:hypothetical protein
MMRKRSTAITHARAGALAFMAVLFLSASAGPALAGTAGTGQASVVNPIEGIWSFNGGQIGVQGRPGGSFVGTVVAPTKLGQCVHPVGEQIWSDMRLQPDGSYWGLHQWYEGTKECIPIPTLGLTAWRILPAANGSRFLRVCFSEPGSNSQPTIAANGTAANDTLGCTDSALVSALPAISSAQFGQYVKFPAAGGCFGKATMRIRMHDPTSDPLEKIVVKLRSGKIHRAAKLKRIGSKITATLNLKGLTAAKFTVTVRLTTVLGSHLSGKRTYALCSMSQRRRSHHHRRHS